MLELARRVQRIDVDQHVAGPQDAGHGHRVLRHVGHHHGHAVALGQAQPLQVGGESPAEGIHLVVVTEADIAGFTSNEDCANMLIDAWMRAAAGAGVGMS